MGLGKNQGHLSRPQISALETINKTIYIIYTHAYYVHVFTRNAIFIYRVHSRPGFLGRLQTEEPISQFLSFFLLISTQLLLHHLLPPQRHNSVTPKLNYCKLYHRLSTKTNSSRLNHRAAYYTEPLTTWIRRRQFCSHKFDISWCEIIDVNCGFWRWNRLTGYAAVNHLSAPPWKNTQTMTHVHLCYSVHSWIQTKRNKTKVGSRFLNCPSSSLTDMYCSHLADSTSHRHDNCISCL